MPDCKDSLNISNHEAHLLAYYTKWCDCHLCSLYGRLVQVPENSAGLPSSWRMQPDSALTAKATKNITIATTYNITHDNLHICRKTKDEGHYYCVGEKYDEFGKKLLAFVNTTNSTAVPNRYDRTKWGRRRFPFPANKSALFIGNSHTRQIFETLICQYKDAVVEMDDSRGTTFYYIKFSNNATFHAVTNHPFCYSKKWAEILEALVSKNLQTFDAVVLGKFNGYKESANTTFVTTMEKMTASMDSSVDFQKVPPPEIKQVAEAYSGPIVLVSMFAKYASGHFQREVKNLKKLRNDGRSNLGQVNARRYVPILGECGSDNRTGIGECNDLGDIVPGRSPKDMHRCTGLNGGHPDLIAWDIVEELDKFV